jgi:hypothetical protein
VWLQQGFQARMWQASRSCRPAVLAGRRILQAGGAGRPSGLSGQLSGRPAGPSCQLGWQAGGAGRSARLAGRRGWQACGSGRPDGWLARCQAGQQV